MLLHPREVRGLELLGLQHVGTARLLELLEILLADLDLPVVHVLLQGADLGVEVTHQLLQGA